MNPFQKKIQKKVQQQNKPKGLRPKPRTKPTIKQSIKNNNESLQKRNISKNKQQPLNHIQKSKLKLTKQFILKNSIFWTAKQDLLQKVKSLILRDQDLYIFQSTDKLKLHQLSTIQLLSLSQNHLTSLHSLAELDSLISLNLNNNDIYQISPLSFLVKLQSLYLNNNKVKEISPLSQLKQLKILHIYNNEIPYQEKERVLKITQNLNELDIESNQVYRQQQKQSWIIGTINRLNGQIVSQKKKKLSSSKGFMNTSQSFFRNSTINFNQANNKLQVVSQIHQNYNDIKKKVQESEMKYIKLDDLYEQQIIKNVRLKSELHKKLEIKANMDKCAQNNKQKYQKCIMMKKQIDNIKQNVFNSTNSTLLRQLYQLTMQYQKKKFTQRDSFKNLMNLNLSTINQKLQSYERKFQPDEEIEINDDQEIIDSDQEINEILNSNSKVLEDLRKQLNQIS